MLKIDINARELLYSPFWKYQSVSLRETSHDDVTSFNWLWSVVSRHENPFLHVYGLSRGKRHFQWSYPKLVYIGVYNKISFKSLFSSFSPFLIIFLPSSYWKKFVVEYSLSFSWDIIWNFVLLFKSLVSK